MSLQKAFNMSLNDDTLSIVLYSAINFYIFEKFETRNQRIFFASISIFGLTVLLNYLNLDEMDEHQNYLNYNGTYEISGSHQYIDPTQPIYY